MTAKSPWTSGCVGKLRQLWAEGLTASQCAAALGNGISRNAVISKVHRLGLAGRRVVKVPKLGAAGRRRRKASRDKGLKQQPTPPLKTGTAAKDIGPDTYVVPEKNRRGAADLAGTFGAGDPGAGHRRNEADGASHPAAGCA